MLATKHQGTNDGELALGGRMWRFHLGTAGLGLGFMMNQASR